MNTLRLDVEIVTVEPAGDTVFVEGRAADGAQIAMYLSAAALRGSALAPGQRVPVTLELPSATAAAPAPAPSLRERMTRSAAGAAAGASATARAAAQAASRSATHAAPASRGAEAPSASQAAPRAGSTAPAARGSDANAGAPARNDTSATLLSFVLGTPGADAGIERDVADEMDALLGRKKRGPGN